MRQNGVSRVRAPAHRTAWNYKFLIYPLMIHVRHCDALIRIVWKLCWGLTVTIMVDTYSLWFDRIKYGVSHCVLVLWGRIYAYTYTLTHLGFKILLISIIFIYQCIFICKSSIFEVSSRKIYVSIKRAKMKKAAFILQILNSTRNSIKRSTYYDSR